MGTESLLIEKVVNIQEMGGRIRIPVPFFCDLHLSDDRLLINVRPESLKRSPKYLNGLNIPFIEVKRVEGRGHDHSIPIKDSEPLTHELKLEYGKGDHFWNKKVLEFGLTTAQNETLRQFLSNRLALNEKVFLQP